MPDLLPWHAMPARDVVSSLDSALQGLSYAEAERRKKMRVKDRAGMEPTPALTLFFRQFANPFVLVLIVAVLVNAYFDEWVNAFVTVIVIWLNAALGFVQEYKADRAFVALQSYLPATIAVLRDGELVRVPADDIVVGDVMVLATGDRIPADGRVLSATMLSVDEAPLSGESTSVNKGTQPVRSDAPVFERASMVFAGTSVMSGRAQVVVTAVGGSTEFGRVATLATATERSVTPLQSEVRDLAVTIAQVVVAVVPLVILVGLLRGLATGQVLLTASALAVAAVPEGLLIALTVILAVAMRRMFARRVLVRKLAAVETLGGIHVLCVDKTGTITAGKMTATVLVDGVRRVAIDDPSAGPLRRALSLMSRTVDGEVDARVSVTESAIAELTKAESVAGYAHMVTLPFSSTYKFSAKLFAVQGGSTMFVLGGPDALFARADASDDELRTYHGVANDLAAKGLRVLAIAERTVAGLQTLTLDDVRDVKITGFVGLEDPLRASVAPAVEQAKSAGIRTIMITGDSAATAKAIAEQAGILTAGDVVTGTEIAAMSDDQLMRVIETTSVFARVLPEQKLAIVRALQRHGLRVAMTGDGVNDAPALKAADVGIAVGHATDVARQTADVVLLESDFANIVDAVREGRVVYENIRKVTAFLVTLSLSSVVLVVVALAFGYALPLHPINILWINVITDGIPAFALAFEPGERGVMRELPRNPHAPILNRSARTFMFGTGAIASLCIVGGMYLLHSWGTEWAAMQTFFYLLLGLSGLAFLYVARTLYRPFWAVRPLSNPWLTCAFFLSGFLLIAPLYIDSVREVFALAPLPLDLWQVLIAIVLIELGLAEMLKAVGFRRRETPVKLVS